MAAEVIGKPPAVDGAFGSSLPAAGLLSNIGGGNDTNENITKRILFLTEGICLSNPPIFEKCKSDLVGRYINNEISDHQLGLFLLNDLIRYYRTVCVDFEFKTFEANKSWGIRNIKLIFSRKLLYVSGVLIVAETAQRTPSEKREIINCLSRLSPIERIMRVCGSSADRAIRSYEKFLCALANPSFRDELNAITSDRKTHTEEFKRLKNEGQHFSHHLMSSIRATYSESHPIHRALIM